ncbi:MAG: DUF4276 family protein [Planctomycetaceae bacterium]|nr:DUF4276 family protein [Planctomycetaceae bacterium]
MVKPSKHGKKESYVIYMEGGGDHNKPLQDELRKGMHDFLEKLNELSKNKEMPSVVPCAGRSQALDRFRTALMQGKNALLLVDSECAVSKKHENKPWDHLKQCGQKHLDKPDGATDEQCHLMVQCMESWFLADPEALEKFYGHELNQNHLPAQGRNLEEIEKEQVYEKLEMATRNCEPKGKYSKRKHSFKLLGLIDPQKVATASGWAKRFFEILKALSQA